MPAYGFERIIDPPPLEVNTRRLLDEFARGFLTVKDVWSTALAPENFRIVEALAKSADDAASFNFPDETWSRVIFDFALAYHRRLLPMDRLIASLVPLYFGRVASLVVETSELTTDQAEAFVERQARAYELAKPYLVERWAEATPAAKPAPVGAAKR